MRYWPILCLLLAACNAAPPPSPALDVVQALQPAQSQGYRQAITPREFVFPADHGPHEGFRNEWWYLTGNLQTPSGRRFGYQVTFFRIAMQPPGAPERSESWATRYLWMAHVALSDLQAQRHYHQERFVREVVGLAGASKAPLSLWVEDWQIHSASNDFPWQIDIKGDDFSLALTLQPSKPVILQGDAGLSQKSAKPGNASYYYSLPRLTSQGEIQIGDTRHAVAGLSWLDREWSTSALDDEQSGWDWFSLQLNDNQELMFYRLRDRQHNTDPHSAGSWIDQAGHSHRLKADDLVLTARRWWDSPTGRRYPVEWEMYVKPMNRRFIITTPLDDQEMDLTVHYWEGAIDVLEQGNKIGQGYLEMTGY